MGELDEYTIPLQNQRVFGAGLKRKRVDFVPAATLETNPPLAPRATPNAGNRYLSIVLPNEKQPDGDADLVAKKESIGVASETHAATSTACNICHLPINTASDDSLSISKPHETSIVHQVCIAHSHPPSHLDRNRSGLKYLSSYGWDPDGRLGLGVRGEGIRVPLKPKVKNDTVGLGVDKARKQGKLKEVDKKIERLDAKGVRKKEVEEKKKRQRLQEMFYGRDDIERYLGGNGLEPLG